MEADKVLAANMVAAGRAVQVANPAAGGRAVQTAKTAADRAVQAAKTAAGRAVATAEGVMVVALVGVLAPCESVGRPAGRSSYTLVV